MLRADCYYAAASQVLVTAACLAALVVHGVRESEWTCNRDRRDADGGLLLPHSREQRFPVVLTGMLNSFGEIHGVARSHWRVAADCFNSR